MISYNAFCFLGDFVASALPRDRLSQVTRRGMLTYTRGRSSGSLKESTGTYPPSFPSVPPPWDLFLQNTWIAVDIFVQHIIGRVIYLMFLQLREDHWVSPQLGGSQRSREGANKKGKWRRLKTESFWAPGKPLWRSAEYWAWMARTMNRYKRVQLGSKKNITQITLHSSNTWSIWRTY